MSRERPTRRTWAALSGLIAAAALLAASELVAAVVAPQASPLLAVGSFVIDVVPRPMKEFAISTFGSFDKPALLIGLGVAVVIAAAVAGLLQARRPPWGAVLLAAGGVAGTAAVVTRAGSSVLALVPPIVGTVAGVIVLVLLVARLRRWTDAVAPASVVDPAPARATRTSAEAAGEPLSDKADGVDRRAFFRFALIAGASAIVIGAGSRIWTATTSSIDSVRRALRLPAPQRTVSIPAGAEFDIPGLSPLITPNADFYRVDTALTVPQVDPSSWRLAVDGMVDEPFELGFDDLLAMGVDEYGITLTCVSNEVGGDLVGTAIWLGVPVRDLLARAKPQSGADMVLSRSVDGFTASTPLASLTDPGLDAVLAVGMNGEPLPLEHGFPVRMVVPGLYGYVSATKWLTLLTVTTFAQDQAYWTPRGYSEKAPIKFSSRVDTPKLGTEVKAGTVPIAGVAWAQTVGIERVEVSVDNGPWQRATLSTPINDDTWVQWMMPWEATAGTHYIAVRAVDKAGNLQVEQPAPIAPDGSSGWQRTLVSVS